MCVCAVCVRWGGYRTGGVKITHPLCQWGHTGPSSQWPTLSTQASTPGQCPSHPSTVSLLALVRSLLANGTFIITVFKMSDEVFCIYLISLRKLPSLSVLRLKKSWIAVGGRRGKNWEVGTDIYTLLCIKQITNKNLLYSTGKSTKNSGMTYMGKESKKERTYTCNWLTLLYGRN